MLSLGRKRLLQPDLSWTLQFLCQPKLHQIVCCASILSESRLVVRYSRSCFRERHKPGAYNFFKSLHRHLVSETGREFRGFEGSLRDFNIDILVATA